MDAFAVTVANTVTVRPFRNADALRSAVWFGAFQFLMPLLGALLAGTISSHMVRFGPWISFALLAFVSGKMILDAVKPGAEEADADTLGAARLFALAVATSIDAMAVGVSFAFSPPSPGLWLSCAAIGCTTFLLTLAAAFLGSWFSNLHPRKAGIAGGTVLIAIGLKILLEGIL